MPARHVIVKGKVQGVFFRATAKEVADQIGVTGWIKNTDDGDVEAVVSGTENQVDDFIVWCKKGPPKAVVTRVEIKDLKDENSFSEFKVIRRWG